MRERNTKEIVANLSGWKVAYMRTIIAVMASERTVQTMSELKPCPFCGGKDIRVLTTLFDCDVFCGNCGAGVHRNSYSTCQNIAENKKDAQPKAVRAWNRRVGNE